MGSVVRDSANGKRVSLIKPEGKWSNREQSDGHLKNVSKLELVSVEKDWEDLRFRGERSIKLSDSWFFAKYVWA